MKLHRFLLRLPAIVAIWSIFITAVPASAQTGTVCDCNDIAQIQYRIQEDANAIVAYGDWILKHPEQERESPEMQEAVLKELNQLNSGNNPLASPFTGNGKLYSTGGVFCATSEPTMNLTPCLRHALELHEAVHREYCNATHGLYRMYQATAGEEVRAYTAERNFLVGERKRLLCNCDYYALKYAELNKLDYSSGTYQQHDVWHLTGNGEDFLTIPLDLHEGSFSGHGSGKLITADTSTGGTGPSLVSCVENGGIEKSFDVTGTMARTLALKANATMQSIQQAGNCRDILGTTPNSLNLAPNVSALGPTLLFTKVDDPLQLDRAVGEGASQRIDASIVVKEKWVNERASNGLGGTIGQALRVIGFVDC